MKFEGLFMLTSLAIINFLGMDAEDRFSELTSNALTIGREIRRIENESQMRKSHKLARSFMASTDNNFP